MDILNTRKVKRLQHHLREVRKAWFSHVIYDHGWAGETEAQKAERISRNENARKLYDKDTEALCRGETGIPQAPQR